LWVSAGALLATLALIALIVMITWSNRARDEALDWERHTYEVMLLTRTIDATIGRSEAALGRYVLDENQQTGTDYYNEWRNAGYQIGQLQRLVQARCGADHHAAEVGQHVLDQHRDDRLVLDKEDPARGLAPHECAPSKALLEVPCRSIVSRSWKLGHTGPALACGASEPAVPGLYPRPPQDMRVYRLIS
jgi:hypothetical protein